MADFLTYSDWLTVQSVSTNYLNAETNDFYHSRGVGKSLAKTIVESQGILLEHRSYTEIDELLISSLTESLQSGKIFEEAFLGKVSRAIRNGMDYAASVKSDFVRLGNVAVQSINGILDKLGKILNSLYETVSSFLSQTWDKIKDSAPKIAAKVRKFISTTKSDQLNSLISVVEMSKGTEELEEASKDIKGSVAKISGKIPYRISDEEKDKLKAAAKDIRNADDNTQEVSHKAEEFLKVEESEVQHLLETINGLLLTEKITLDDVFLQLNEEKQVKSVYAWALEATGFLLSPFGKMVEYMFKNGVNFLLNTLSIVHRGMKDAYKYIIMGTIAGLVYHIVHSVHAAHDHAIETWEGIQKVVEEGKFDMKTFHDISQISYKGIGLFMWNVLKIFFPTVTWIMEQVIIAAAVFELMLAVCEMSPKGKSTKFCSALLNTEHKMERILKGEHK